MSTIASTLVSVIPEESLEIFTLDQIHDFYYNGYSQDEADVVRLFLGKHSIVLWHFLRLTLYLNLKECPLSYTS